jgi:PAS domain S-box-containing protein
MKIKTKILWTLLGMSLLVALVGALAVNRQHVVATVGATKEAENVARVLGFLLSDSNSFSVSAQEIITKLNQAEGRDVVLMDTNQLILADAVASDIGKIFKGDTGDEVGATLKDQRARIFIEISSDSLLPIKQIVVPAQDHSGHVIGAVVLEYTPLYDELMQSTRTTTRQVILAAVGSVTIALLIALYMGRSIVVPLQQLTNVATGFASGKTDLPMPPPQKNEIGELANAFNNMVQKRQQAEEELWHARDELEIRVTERTAELAKSNEMLRVENAERKRAEQELRWKTAFLEAQVNSSIDGILVVDEQGKKILQNQRLADLLKIPQHIVDDKDDETQRQWITGMTKNPEQFVEKIAYLNAHLNETSRDEIELKDGTILDRYSSPLAGKDGKYYGRIWTFRDITERRQTEMALRSSEERFRIAAETANDVVYEWDLKQSVEWLGKIDDMLGYEPGEFPRTLNGWAASVHPEDLERTMAAIQAHLEGRVPFAIEYRVRRKDGVYRWWSARGAVARTPDGKPDRWIGSITDFTESKRAENALLQLAAIIESSDDAVIGKDLNSTITSWNKGAEKIFGYTAGEMVGTSIMRLIPTDRQDEENRILERIKRGENEENFETLRQTKDERLIDVSVTASPIKDAAGKVIGVSKVARDITGRKQLEARLFQSQKMETVGKLAGGIAHEFNSILTAIIGQSELLLGALPAGSPLVNNATEISKAAGRAATLTRQLLAYGRKQFLQPETLDLNRVIAGMKGMFHHLMGGKVDTQIVPAAGLNAVKADAGQIEQVIMNMALNARDAMPNGGKLTLETANVSFDQESVGRYPELKPGDYVMLAITDTGTGMSEEVKARVFEPFFTTKDVGQGTGLGLSTCYGIIKQSGGHISVYSELARGATFKIYLPQVEQPTEIPLQRLDSPDLRRGTETILLVEDDPALREMAATLLKGLGYTVLTAANGIEALSVQHERSTGHVDLLFTDVVMPHMNGMELADRVRALYPHTRILFTSAYTENAIVHQGVLNKGVALLQKPFTPSALARKLREVLDQPNTPKPDPAQKTFGFTKISDEVKALGN